ncbi:MULTISPECIES: copper resistance system multicopper oxidase [Sphingomonadaceae]|jgi:CopA family copper-resistance protein|nr:MULTISPECIES: copper resistance system multicopper oxidase [Sphingomonadaceae]ALC14746.1 copper-binding protein [Sphingopyxis sp. 113P3]KTF70283.1 copper-binding protein [Sphingomonas sp. WG]RSV38085.1 copper resistance system multicopper oxidase [Sphingomonas sp. ABOLD]
MSRVLDRRQVLRGATMAGGGLALSAYMPAWAQSVSAGIAKPLPTVSGEDITLRVAHQKMMIDGRESHAIGINGTVPAPLIRLREGQNVRLHVVNDLDEETSIHWHGLLVPFQMDGVPGISFPGIPARSTFTYEFPIIQSGTYWYHSHSGLQEQDGHYGPILIDPKDPDPVQFDREHVIVLSDHSFQHSHYLFDRLKKESGYFNRQRQTLAGLLAGKDQPLKERLMWGKMRMDPADVADVTGSTYTYLVNGHGPRDNWTALFKPGERVRLRFINASSMTTFNVRIPGLPMTIVAADGLNVRPVQIDEFQFGPAETYDAIVTPPDMRAYTLVGESVDRSGQARATLAPREGMAAEVPPLRKRPLATMKDMGMGGHDMGTMDHGAMQGMGNGAAGAQAGSMAGMDHSAMNHGAGAGSMQGMNHSQMNHGTAAAAAGGMAGMAMPQGQSGTMAGMDHGSGAMPGMAGDQSMAGMDMGGMDMGNMNMRDFSKAPEVKKGPGVQTISAMPVDRTGDPGQGLENVGHRVLTYRDLMALDRNPDTRAPEREIKLHLTGNMERYMWGFDGEKLSENPDPITLLHGERVRVTLINDTMMGHPIHIHGHFFELVTGKGAYAPRKHTVLVQPGGTVSWDVTGEEGDWAFHCHMLYHMHAGMMRVVQVRKAGEAAA